MPEDFHPAKSLRDAYNAANPTQPLLSGDPRYVDCHDVRGDEDTVERMFRTINWSTGDADFASQLFTGHRGCGKSTELLRLKHRLEEANFAVIYLAADELLDLESIEYSDILFAITRSVYEGLQEHEVELDPGTLEAVREWFTEVIIEKTQIQQTELQAKTETALGLPANPFARVMASITGSLKTSADTRKTIRDITDPYISELINNINLLLNNGNIKLQQSNRRGLVVIVDNLDRIPFRLLDSRTEHNNYDAIYLEHGEQLCALKCHLVYTVPIALFHSARTTRLADIFHERYMLPMIKVRTQDGEIWDTGVERLKTILERRIDLDAIFERDALEMLCINSGGHPRDLMHLVRYACHTAEERYPRPISVQAVESAIKRMMNDYSRIIPEGYFSLLAAVHHTKEVQNDLQHRDMLQNLMVLEYMNGGPPWHDVHPAVLQLPKFTRALTALQTESDVDAE